MRIQVTDADIKAGRKLCPDCCPIALALTRALNLPEFGVLVDSGWIRLGQRRWSTPKQASEFVRCFDNDVPVAPFSFELPEGEPPLSQEVAASESR